MSDDFDTHWLPDNRDAMRRWYLENVAGTYHSNWWFLISAAASSFFIAARGLSETIEAWKRARERGQDRAETTFVLELNYERLVSGPLIAAVLAPSFALESFLRLCAEIALKLHTKSAHAFQLAISGYDTRAFEDRVHDGIALSRACEIPDDLRKSAGVLIAFRNSLVHDMPLSHSESGALQYVKRGREKTVQEDKVYEGMYPLMYDNTMPLSLRHAKTALVTHDRVMHHIMDQADEKFIESLKKLAPTQLIAECMQGVVQSYNWDQTDPLIEFWESTVLKWYQSIPMKERKKYLEARTRRSKVKPVD